MEINLGLLKRISLGKVMVSWIAVIARLAGGRSLYLRENETAGVYRDRLAIHALFSALWGALFLSIAGLATGNIHSPLFISALILLTGLALTSAYRHYFRPACPKCSAPVFRSKRVPLIWGKIMGWRTCDACGTLRDGWRRPLSSTGSVVVRGAFWRLEILAMITAVSFFAGVEIGGWGWSWVGRYELTRVKKEIEAAGFIIQPPPAQSQVSNERNAAYWYHQAVMNEQYRFLFKRKFSAKEFYQLRKKNELSESDFICSFISNAKNDQATDREYTEARNLVEKYKDLIALIRKGAEQKDVSWGQWDPSLEPITFLNIRRLVAVDAICEARFGSRSLAVKKAGDILKIGDDVAKSDTMIGAVLAVGMVRTFEEVVDAVLNRVDISEAQRSWMPLLQPQKVIDRYLRVYCFEFGRYEPALMQYVNPMEELFTSSYGIRNRIGWQRVVRAIRGWEYGPFLAFDIAAKFRVDLGMAKAFQAQPYAQQEKLFKDVAEMARKKLWLLGRIGFYPESQLRIYKHVLVGEARIQLIRAKVTAKAFKDKKGRWPARIEELEKYSGLVLNDPFSQGKLVLKNRQDRKVIYSIGPDGVDNDGAEFKNSKMTGDVVSIL